MTPEFLEEIKGYKGHGYDSEDTCLLHLRKLAKLNFRKSNIAVMDQVVYDELINHCRRLYFLGKTEFGFSNIKESIERMLEEVDKDLLFVYGTLQRKERNYHFVKNSRFIGDAILHNHTLLELGSFPGAIAELGKIVHGEIYEVNQEVKTQIDYLEGSLYECKKVVVEKDTMVYVVHTYIYIASLKNYEGEYYPLSRLRGKCCCIDHRYVWNVTYGSNINSQRFQAYLDQTISYKLAENVMIQHPMYFA